ncbi:MAG: dihydroneopterin aldolase [Arsenophonus sp.]|nr:MAG: dihydroneopterin aldolase [Arsenophonus sp.]
MDVIIIKKLTVFTIIGIHDWEKKNRQKLIINIKMKTDISKALQSINIKDCLDYEVVTKTVINFVENKKFLLIESVAQEIAKMILKKFKTSWVRIEIFKSGIMLNTKYVGIMIERSRNMVF